jgi:hypothetical protein
MVGLALAVAAVAVVEVGLLPGMLQAFVRQVGALVK